MPVFLTLGFVVMAIKKTMDRQMCDVLTFDLTDKHKLFTGMLTVWKEITAGTDSLSAFYLSYLSYLKHLTHIANPFIPKHTAAMDGALKAVEKEENK
jgi:hypothetical protein